MDNKDAWDKAQLIEWQKFWNSEMGQAALEKFNQLKQACLDAAIRAGKHEDQISTINMAAGVQLVLDDIQTGILKAEKAVKEDSTAKK